ncbi:hypothetical protein L484_017083 [Morus notabilis]|uniref:Uncharacterized protein n=1 Tax=Morus notabilis TaxID=981085 RepID=W9SC43_9ROSA|nr:hypothetical protein L484_017083 [Morus notabilis]
MNPNIHENEKINAEYCCQKPSEEKLMKEPLRDFQDNTVKSKRCCQIKAFGPSRAITIDTIIQHHCA